MALELPPGTPDLLTPAEVARLFRVDPKTVTRWGSTFQLAFIRTLGGHRRYLRSDVQAALNEGFAPSTERAQGGRAAADGGEPAP